MSELIRAWEAEGETVGIDGRRLFVVDRAGPPERPALLLLHGFPASSFDWQELIAGLAGQARILAFDFLGFGLSDKPRDHPYSLFDQADLTERLLAARGVERAMLVAHDMGDTVAAELLARAHEGRSSVDWTGCVLTNGSIFIDMAQLTAGQQALLALPDEPLAESLGAEGLRAGLAASFPPDRPDPAVLAAMVRLNQHGGGDLLLPRLIRYIEERREHQPRWTAGLQDFPGPVVAAWGDLDPIAVAPMADRLEALRHEAGHPVEVVHWPDVGHWPSVEAPDRLAALVADRLARWS